MTLHVRWSCKTLLHHWISCWSTLPSEFQWILLLLLSYQHMNKGSDWLAAVGLEVIQRRAEESRFPLMRLVNSTLIDDVCVTSDTTSLFWQSNKSLLSSRPSKISKTLQRASLSAATICSVGLKSWSSLRRLYCSSLIKFSSLNESRITRLTSWFSRPSAQSRANFYTAKVFPMPAMLFVRTILINLFWLVRALKMSWHLIGLSHSFCILDIVSSCHTSCCMFIPYHCPENENAGTFSMSIKEEGYRLCYCLRNL